MSTAAAGSATTVPTAPRVQAPSGYPRPVPSPAESATVLRPRLGDVLLRQGLITPDVLAAALDHQRTVGEPLGTVLLAQGLVTRRDLYAALAEVWNTDLTFVSPDDVDVEFASHFHADELARDPWVPLRIETDGDGRRTAVVAVAGRPRQDVEDLVHLRVQVDAVRQVVTTDWDVHRALRTGWREELVHLAVRSLAERFPEQSASQVLTRPQQVVGLAAVVVVVVAFVVDAHRSLQVTMVVVAAAFAISVAAKLAISVVGVATPLPALGRAEAAAMTDADLPHVTILVPAYREEAVVGLLMANLAQLDYPLEKLEILLLLEEDDPATLEAALAAHPPEVVRVLVIPESQPRTKPRACNVGLAFARGDVVVIYDAEDRPEPQQLRTAVGAFAAGGDDLICVQAALNYFNPHENWLTRMFTLEYSCHFDNVLPGLDRLRLPIPLGGTSNFFRTDMLRELGGWDPYNVTEDADLGIRVSARGWRVAVIDSTTFEEANVAVGNWLRQRSRWIKGYMQTFLVHTRHPVRLVRAAGLMQVLAFALLIGGTPLAFLASPLLWAVFALTLVDPGAVPAVPDWLKLVNALCLVVGNTAAVYLHVLAVFRRRVYSLAPYALMAPAYWVLHSLAAYKALWQLVTKPFYWEKTTHGLSRVLEAADHQDPPLHRDGASVNPFAVPVAGVPR